LLRVIEAAAGRLDMTLPLLYFGPALVKGQRIEAGQAGTCGQENRQQD
jgi:hypothetical protein